MKYVFQQNSVTPKIELLKPQSFIFCVCECVCVYLCVREREREGEENSSALIFLENLPIYESSNLSKSK